MICRFSFGHIAPNAGSIGARWIVTNDSELVAHSIPAATAAIADHVLGFGHIVEQQAAALQRLLPPLRSARARALRSIRHTASPSSSALRCRLAAALTSAGSGQPWTGCPARRSWNTPRVGADGRLLRKMQKRVTIFDLYFRFAQGKIPHKNKHR